MKKLTLALFSATLFAQTPGIVTVGTTVTASAAPINCAFSNPAAPTIHITCTDGTGTMTQDATPTVGATNGIIGQFSSTGNSITWAIQQPTAGSITWTVVANGTSKTGSF